jgi:hypothetical protein
MSYIGRAEGFVQVIKSPSPAVTRRKAVFGVKIEILITE